MGPSGAGKTTLLDFLTGTLGSSLHAFGRVSLPDNDAYVPQDDRLHVFYTCQSYMEHYARMSGQMSTSSGCCGSKATTSMDEEGGSLVANHGDGGAEADALIASILDEVGLSAQKDTVVGGMFKRGLSGGQKRRLSVALEAITSPLNMFLDEPTSGLDSESALRLMQYLHRYARGIDPTTGERRRVIVTIHQPSSRIWELIDNVVLMAEGRLIYQGRRQQMEDFFTAFGHPVPPNFNPADHYIEALAELPIPSPSTDEDCNATESQSTAEMWYESFREWTKNESYSRVAKSRPSVLSLGMPSTRRTESVVIRSDPSNRTLKARKQVQSTLLSSFELIRRSFTGLYKNPVVLGLRVAVYTGISVALGILFFNLANDRNPHSILIGRTSILYFVVAFFSTMSVAAIPFAIVERGIVQKEVRNHRYHPVFYHLSQAISSLPACLLLSGIGV
eukprot:g12356.t1.1.5e17418b.1.5e1746ac g12356  g12356.t1 contig6:1757240-1758742(+)